MAVKTKSISQSGRKNDNEISSEQQVLVALRKIMRGVDLYSRKLRSSHNLTGPQLLSLLALAKEDTLKVSDIAHRVHLSASTIVGILDRLEEKGLVQRERSKHDRRQVHASITKTGRSLAMKSPSPLQDKLAEALKDLSDSEQKEIALSLEQIVAFMDIPA